MNNRLSYFNLDGTNITIADVEARADIENINADVNDIIKTNKIQDNYISNNINSINIANNNISVINNRLGNSDISSVGDGSVTGGISYLQNEVNNLYPVWLANEETIVIGGL